jgi:AcrR family transcriptional regulator
MDRRPRGRPRSEPVEVQRRRILDAARSAFTTVGYDAATVAQIATAANVARPVVYDTLGDKEALLLAVAEEMSDELVAAFDERFARPEQVERPLAEVVRDDLAWFVAWIRAHPSFVSVTRLSSALTAHGPDPAAYARRRIEDRLTQLHMRRAERWGVDRGESARIISLLVIALAEAVAYRIGVEEEWPAEAATAIAIEFATGGYLQIEGAGREAADRFDDLLATGMPSDAEQAVDSQGDAIGK